MKLIWALLIWCMAVAPTTAAPQAYQLEKAKSKVGFSWFLGKEEIRGSMPINSANIVLDLENLKNSNVRVTLNVKEAKAGFPFATQGLKSKEILWADKFPQIIFRGTSIERNGNSASIKGNLTIRGVTKPAIFKARLSRQAGSASGDNSNLSVRMTGTVNRSEFGATGWPKLAGDRVKLDITASIKRKG